MIITKKEPFSAEEIKKLSEEYGTYIKTVIDIDQQYCSAGANLHLKNEQELLKNGSNQADLWGGGIDLETKTIDFNSMINLRPSEANTSNEIQDPAKRLQFENLMKYFFEEIL